MNKSIYFRQKYLFYKKTQRSLHRLNIQWQFQIEIHPINNYGHIDPL